MCLLDTTAPVFLGETEEVLIWCFHQLNHPDLYSKATLLTEHILMARKVTLNLCAIPNLHKILQQLDHWMRFIDDPISDEIALGESSMLESYSGGGLTDPCSSLVNDLVDRVEVLYVLGLLLVGKHRKQVQKELADLQLIPKLSTLFDSFIWRSNGGRQRTRLPGHYPGCECSPEVALKIQFLRLVHSFCSHCGHKMSAPVSGTGSSEQPLGNTRILGSDQADVSSVYLR